MIFNDISTTRLFEDENQIIYNSRGNVRSDSSNIDLRKLITNSIAMPQRLTCIVFTGFTHKSV